MLAASPAKSSTPYKQTSKPTSEHRSIICGRSDILATQAALARAALESL